MSPPPFPDDEFTRRASALQAGLGGADLAALVVTTPADIAYVSGFVTRFWESPTRPWFVILPQAGPPVAVIPAIGRDLMARTWIDDIRVWDAPAPADDGVTLLAETLCDLVPESGRIGLQMGPETHLRMPLDDYRAVSEQVAPRRFADATDVVRRVREIKSEAEIARIRAACRTADTAFAAVPDIAAPGRGLDAVFRDFQIAILQAGADWVGYLAGAAGPGGYGDVISPAGPELLREGDVLMLDTGAVLGGYSCDFDRNFALGRADDAAVEAHTGLILPAEAAAERVLPGMAARDLHRIMSVALTERGLTPAGGRFGHGLGPSLTEWPSLTPWDTTELRAGMVLTLEPCVEISSGRIMVHEENLVLRADGAEWLSSPAPRHLPVIGP